MKKHFAITALLGLMEPHQVHAVKVEVGIEAFRSPTGSTCHNNLDYFDCMNDPSYCEWNCHSTTCVPLKPECHMHECQGPCLGDPVNSCKWTNGKCTPDNEEHLCSLNRDCDACDNDWRNDCEWNCEINRCRPRGENCEDHKCERPCHDDGCFWHEKTRTCKVTPPENSRCEVLNNMYTCVEDSKCEWDCHKRQCITVQPNCTDHNCRDACENDPFNNCYWNPFTTTCGTEEPKVPTCADNDTPSKCVYDPNNNCEWDCDVEKCVKKGSECSEHKCEAPCDADQDNNCQWNKTSSSCETKSEKSATCKDYNPDPFACRDDEKCEWDCQKNTCKAKATRCSEHGCLHTCIKDAEHCKWDEVDGVCTLLPPN